MSVLVTHFLSRLPIDGQAILLPFPQLLWTTWGVGFLLQRFILKLAKLVFFILNTYIIRYRIHFKKSTLQTFHWLRISYKDKNMIRNFSKCAQYWTSQVSPTCDLGIIAVSKAPWKGKSFKILGYIQSFRPYRAYGMWLMTHPHFWGHFWSKSFLSNSTLEDTDSSLFWTNDLYPPIANAMLDHSPYWPR